MNTPPDKRITLRVTGRQAAFINYLAIAHITRLREGTIKARHATHEDEDTMARALNDKTWVIYEEHMKRESSRAHHQAHRLSVTPLTQGQA